MSKCPVTFLPACSQRLVYLEFPGTGALTCSDLQAIWSLCSSLKNFKTFSCKWLVPFIQHTASNYSWPFPKKIKPTLKGQEFTTAEATKRKILWDLKQFPKKNLSTVLSYHSRTETSTMPRQPHPAPRGHWKGPFLGTCSPFAESMILWCRTHFSGIKCPLEHCQ